MKKIAIGIIIFLLCVLAGVFLSGCDLEINTSSSKNKDVIEFVSGERYIHRSIFRDTETGREYIVFRYGEAVAMTPRLEKEDKE